MIVILIQTAERRRVFGMLQLAVSAAVFPTDAGLQGQTTVGPELPFGTKPVGRLDKGNQHSHPDRTQPRNLAQKSARRVFPTLAPQLLAGLPMQGPQII